MMRKYVSHNKLSQVSGASKKVQKKFFTSSLVQKSAAQTVTPVDHSKKEHYFDKILVANRGEIACRVMRTCKKLGIKTVAVYSEADANCKHVIMADEAVYIGKAPVKDSYLKDDRIIEAMKSTGAQAVHPGFGFLSENTDFAHAVEDAGMVFIGPPSSAIKAMGDKIESKLIAKKANVNTIPGYDGEVESPEHAVELAKSIGYPVMIKASAGGGGKGIRIAWNDKELVEGFKLSQAEAINFFKDKKMLIEKFVQNPRHVEIQILGDKFGNRVYLNERECSIQRRNQKVVEEAPCVALDPKTRAAMGTQAVTLAAAVGYTSAGTVEMLLDDKNNFYFLEMNTRLQVEHPITEMITGVDIVEQMIRVAAGYPLPFKQENIGINGWATECRVYAEDPTKGFGTPSIGRLDTYKEPSLDNGTVRIDSGILQGSEISVFYDPMISKLITWGKDRNESIKKMIDALDSYVISGVKHNIPLLRTIMENKVYNEGKLTTSFLNEQFPEGFKGIEMTTQRVTNLTTAAAVMEFISRRRDMSVTGRLPLAEVPEEMELVVSFAGKEYPVTVSKENDLYIVDIKLKDHDIDVIVNTNWQVGETIFKAKLNEQENVTMQFLARETATKLRMVYLGNEFHVSVQTPAEKKFSKFMPVPSAIDSSKTLLAPMPGAIVKINVKPGDKVFAGQEVLVIEAMKMQNSLRCVQDSIVKKVNVQEGQVVQNNALLIEYE